METQPRIRFTWTEVLVGALVLGLLFLIFAPAMQRTGRVPGRRVACKNNLANLGKALHNYNAGLGCFPPGAIYGESTIAADGTSTLTMRGFQQTGYASLMPYMEATAITNVWLRKRPWHEQPSAYCVARMSVFECPKNAESKSPAEEPFLEIIGRLSGGQHGNRFGTTSYVFCKGVTDAWCLTPGNVQPWKSMAAGDLTAVASTERGMFDIAFPDADNLAGGPFVTTIATISDGTSNTIAMGEAWQGPDWPLTKRGHRNFAGPRTAVQSPDGAEYPAYQLWALPPNTSEGVNQGLYLASVFGCTLEPLGTNPVTHTVIETDPADLLNCRASLDWDGPAGPARGGGVHRTSNFRADHDGGAHFLYADASVHFISNSIDLKVYRAMSTIAGDEGLLPPNER